MNADDLVDTRLLRRLTLAGGGLLVLGAVLWLLSRGAGGLPNWLGVGVMLLTLVPLGMLLAQLQALRRAAERQLQASAAQRLESERNQRSILQLLDEMASLADGDLTVQATVTEDITGAIADSVNYAVEALRKLVATINHSALQVDASARQTQSLGAQLGKASAIQAKQITSATESIAAMAAGAVGALGEVWGDMQKASGAMSRISEVLGAVPAISAPANPVALPVPAQVTAPAPCTVVAEPQAVRPGESVLLRFTVPAGRLAFTGRDGRRVVGVGVLTDVEPLLHLEIGVGEERPEGARGDPHRRQPQLVPRAVPDDLLAVELLPAGARELLEHDGVRRQAQAAEARRGRRARHRQRPARRQRTRGRRGCGRRHRSRSRRWQWRRQRTRWCYSATRNNCHNRARPDTLRALECLPLSICWRGTKPSLPIVASSWTSRGGCTRT